MIAEQLKRNVVSYLADNLLGFEVVADLSPDLVSLPRCVVEVTDDGEEIIGHVSRLQVTVTMHIEAASENAQSTLDVGTHDLDIALDPFLFQQGCSADGVVVAGALAGTSSSELSGEIWTRSRSITAFCTT